MKMTNIGHFKIIVYVKHKQVKQKTFQFIQEFSSQFLPSDLYEEFGLQHNINDI